MFKRVTGMNGASTKPTGRMDVLVPNDSLVADQSIPVDDTSLAEWVDVKIKWPGSSTRSSGAHGANPALCALTFSSGFLQDSTTNSRSLIETNTTFPILRFYLHAPWHQLGTNDDLG